MEFAGFSLQPSYAYDEHYGNVILSAFLLILVSTIALWLVWLASSREIREAIAERKLISVIVSLAFATICLMFLVSSLVYILTELSFFTILLIASFIFISTYCMNWLIFFVVLRVKLAPLSLVARAPQEDAIRTVAEAMEQPLAYTIHNLDLRVKRLKRRSDNILIMIFLIIALSACFVVAAGPITQIGINLIDEFSNARDRYNVLFRQLQSVRESVTGLTSMRSALQRMIVEPEEELVHKIETLIALSNNDEIDIAAVSHAISTTIDSAAELEHNAGEIIRIAESTESSMIAISSNTFSRSAVRICSVEHHNYSSLREILSEVSEKLVGFRTNLTEGADDQEYDEERIGSQISDIFKDDASNYRSSLINIRNIAKSDVERANVCLTHLGFLEEEIEQETSTYRANLVEADFVDIERSGRGADRVPLRGVARASPARCPAWAGLVSRPALAG